MTTQQEQTFNSFDNPTQNLLLLLTAHYEGITQTNFVKLLRLADIKDDKKYFNRNSIALVLNKLLRLGFVTKKNTYYKAARDVAPFLFQKVANKTAYIQIVRKQNPINEYIWHFNYDVITRMQRELYIGLYQKDPEHFFHFFSRLFEETSFAEKTQISMSDYLEQLFFKEAGTKWFTSLSFDFQANVLIPLHNSKLVGLEDTKQYTLLLQKILANKKASKWHQPTTDALLIEGLLKGDWASIKKLLALKIHPITKAANSGFLHFAQGLYPQALENYEAALTLVKKEGSKKDQIGNIFGLSHLLLLTQQAPNPKLQKQIQKHIQWGIENVPLISYPLIQHLQEALRNNKEPLKEFYADYAEDLNMIDYETIFYLHIQYWTDTLQADFIKLATAFYNTSIKNGYKWLSFQVCSLLAKTHPQKGAFYEKQAQQFGQELGINTPLLELIPRLEKWEIALQALQTIAIEQQSSSQKTQSKRLIWLVDFERDLLEAKAQVVKKSGGWSKGRKISPERIKEGQIEEATIQDIKIATGFKLYSGWGGSDWSLDRQKAYKALVGHPFLFLLKSTSIACELIEAPLELIVEQTKNGFQLKYSEQVHQTGVQVIKETPTRYKLVEVTQQHLDIANALGGKSVAIPEAATEQLQETISKLAAVVTIQSDLAEHHKDIPVVDPDPRIYVHLLPVGDGFHVEFFVKPFQKEAPYFKPGEGRTNIIAEIEGNRLQTQRDLKEEEFAALQTRKACPLLVEMRPRKGVWALETAEECLQILQELKALQKEDKVVVEWPKGEKLRIAYTVNFENLKLGIKKENDWFGINGELQLDENLVLSMKELLALAANTKTEFIELDEGRFLSLSKQLKKQLNALNQFANIDKKGNITIHPLASVGIDEWSDQLKELEVDQAWTDHINHLKESHKKRFMVPRKLKAELRAYQKEGYQWLARLAHWGVGACLADDMGLGKTIQAISIILNRAKNGPTLVVAPASVCPNWIKEIKKFAPSLTPQLFGFGDREKMLKSAKKNDVIITTYGLVQSDSEAFANKKFTTIVLDEAQAIKNRTAKRSKAAMDLQGDFKIITTGTPIENHLGELWNLFQFINPGLLGTWKQFQERYATPIEKHNDLDVKDSLKQLIQPFILRRRKDEVLKELPAKTEINLQVELSEEEKAFYEALRQNALENIEKADDPGTKAMQILAQITKLRQASCHPKLVTADSKIQSSKLHLFTKIVAELIENGHKALVFSQFVGHLKLIEAVVKKLKIKYQYLDGSTPMKERQKRVDAFQNGEGNIFLISLKAGGTGLNLTAADYVIHMDPWWNPAVEDQASDRVHRIGQQRPVTVYRLVTHQTIEEKIIKLHEHKRDLADSLLDGTSASAKLSTKELLALIQS